MAASTSPSNCAQPIDQGRPRYWGGSAGSIVVLLAKPPNGQRPLHRKLVRMAITIREILRNLPVILFLAAFVIPKAKHRDANTHHYLAWILLLSVGIEAISGGLFHVFFPSTASAATAKPMTGLSHQAAF